MAKEKEALCDVLYELGMVKEVLKPMLVEGKRETVVSFATLANINMLMGIAEAKIRYYQDKYDFQVDYPDDVFYPEDIASFLQFKSKGNGQGEADKEE